MNFEEMSNRQITAAAKARDIVFNYAWSCGGGREDPNRDHQDWYIEIWEGFTSSNATFVNEFVAYCGGSGRFDGKAYCERLAKRIAMERAIRRHDARLTDEA